MLAAVALFRGTKLPPMPRDVYYGIVWIDRDGIDPFETAYMRETSSLDMNVWRQFSSLFFTHA